ncbi:eukaryotic translation initiation factor SUI1 family protein [Lentinula boryana]|uniref:Eukaryotic translation initiation factor SUI1 family protein n=1 Tax=Lentinula boryana TaxID=40481 RepID=A0ABQ8QRL3_9AGAR|nr:eukaryotic translation initiation factor SUI1 family protein [Lentinula boryana]
MFKKPVNNWKTSSPLRTSDRKKLRLKVASSFSIDTAEADVLVPEGILSVKFKSHLNDSGVAYLAPDGDHDPLWFILGKGTDAQQEDALIIPTVYTLWKNSKLLPFLSTPKAVIPILIGGADLMIPGVVHCSQSLNEGQLVSICKYERVDVDGTLTPMLSPPLAVGRMVIGSDQLQDSGQERGKAVYILHTWKDHLWELGSKGDVPMSEPIKIEGGEDMENTEDSEEKKQKQEGDAHIGVETIAAAATQSDSDSTKTSTYTPDEVSQLLRMSLVQAISQSLGSLPVSAFPIPATIFYTNHILPNRPNYPVLVLPFSSAPSDDLASTDLPGPDPSSITIKTSSHKSLTAFLKSAEKSGLISTKTPQKHSAQTDMLVTAVNASHPDVQVHRSFATIGEAEAKAVRKTLREEEKKKQQAAASLELDIRELWKPHLNSVELFEAMMFSFKLLNGVHSPSNLYNLQEVRSLLSSYFATHQLVNSHDQAYINLDRILMMCVVPKPKLKSSKNKSSSAKAESEPQAEVEFMKRDDLIKGVLDTMQSWYQVRNAGDDVLPKKGKLSPIQVAMKTRQGRKVSTLITGFEPFNLVAEDLSEDLRKLCAGATSIAPIPGKPANSGMEVLVQGKQSKAVVDYLQGKGVPKKWIEAHDVIKGKK